MKLAGDRQPENDRPALATFQNTPQLPFTACTCISSAANAPRSPPPRVRRLPGGQLVHRLVGAPPRPASTPRSRSPRAPAAAHARGPARVQPVVHRGPREPPGGRVHPVHGDDRKPRRQSQPLTGIDACRRGSRRSSVRHPLPGTPGRAGMVVWPGEPARDSLASRGPGRRTGHPSRPGVPDGGYDGAPFGLLVVHPRRRARSTSARGCPHRINVDPGTAAVTLTTDPVRRRSCRPS